MTHHETRILDRIIADAKALPDDSGIHQAWREYDSAARWCAVRGIKGRIGDRLPQSLSSACCKLISDDPEAFEDRVKATAFAISMKS